MSIQLTKSAAAAVRRGHPWVYREGAIRPPSGLTSGAVVELVDETKAPLGRALWDASSPIAARVFTTSPHARLDEAFIASRVEAALALRDAWFQGDPETTAYRLMNGEGDRAPGLVIDRYGSVAVVRLDGDFLRPWIDRLKKPLAAALARRGVDSIGIRASAEEAAASPGKKLRPLFGREPPDRVIARESGLAMEVDLAEGQKTGAFLDQRENRARVRELARGRARVLNLFSYAGGFSIAAAAGGAGRVTSVDVAAAAHATAQRTFRANDVDPARHAFVAADVFAFLEQAKSRGDRFDLIISDPPSFAPSERAKSRALAAYRRLHAAAALVLEGGGVLCAASCSSHISAEDFLSTLDDAALGRSDLRLLAMHGQPKDHPTLPVWFEGRYLKFAVLG